MGLRICLLIDHPGVRQYFLRAIQDVQSSTDADVASVVVNEAHTTPPDSVLDAAEDGLVGVLGHLRRRVAGTPDYLRYVPLEETDLPSAATVHHTEPIPLDDELGHRLPDELVDQVVSDADVVVRHGFGILKGRILTEPDHGVLSFHHGDIRRYRGVALGFWNFIEGEPTSGVTLQRLTPELDGGEIVVFREIDIDDCHTWQSVKERLFQRSIPMLAEGIDALCDPDFEPQRPDSLGELYYASDMWDPQTLGRYVIKNTVGRVRRHLG